MTTIPPHVPGVPDDPDLDAAAARLQAWQGGQGWHPVEDGPGDLGPSAGYPEPADDAAQLAERLRERRSARHVAAAYSAAHGHPLGGSEAPAGRPRWGIGLRAAVGACVAVLLLAAGAAAVALGGRDDVVTLASVDEAPASATLEPVEPSEAPPSPSPSAPPPTPSSDGADGPDGGVVVHVVGEVAEPGLVSLPAGARVADAVEAAGGATSKAEVASVNLARDVVDGEQIVVPAPGQTVPEAGAAEGGGADGAGVGGVLDLNAAAPGDLEELPGVGPVLAERIVAWRDEQGPFTSVDELEAVSGIGPSVLEQVRDLVRV